MAAKLRLPPAALALALALGLGLASLEGCLLPNPNHCLNLAIDPNTWCVENHDDLPFCSPCVAENNGCVAEEPSEEECPNYSGSPLETGTGTGTDTDTEGTDGSDTSDSDTDSSETSTDGSDSGTG